MSFDGTNFEPVWESGDGPSAGLAVYVNGGLIEISCERLLVEPDEAGELGLQFVQALVDARRWARRWNTETRTYDAEAAE